MDAGKKYAKSKEGLRLYEAIRKQLPKNRSPSPLVQTKKDLLRKIEFCKNELKLHITSENHRMSEYKRQQIRELEKKLK